MPKAPRRGLSLTPEYAQGQSLKLTISLIEILLKKLVRLQAHSALILPLCCPQGRRDQLQEVFNYYIKGRGYRFTHPPGIPFHP